MRAPFITYIILPKVLHYCKRIQNNLTTGFGMHLMLQSENKKTTSGISKEKRESSKMKPVDFQSVQDILVVVPEGPVVVD